MKNRPFMLRYFAGSLNGQGFLNYIPDAISGMKKIYIIKGTPGSGKSTLMKKIAHAAEENGALVERIYCSSDPSSLDGVVIPSISFAIIDGTSPHVMDATYPLAVETIINTGDYLNPSKIESHRDKIIFLTNEKKRLFSQGESLLKAALALENTRYDILETAYNSNKGFKYCKNIILKEAKFKTEGEIIKRSCFAFCKDGFSTMSSFPDASKKYSISDKFSPFILGTLKLLAAEYKIPAIYSPDPLNPKQTGALYFPVSGHLFATAAHFPEGETVSEDRFAKPDILKKNKEKLRFLSKTKNLILSESSKYLTEAMNIHSQLEKIYGSCLNTDGLDCLAESMILSLFGE